MKRYGYHRTSTREQHLDRGIKEITTYCEQKNLELEKIFTDQQTGKNFNRPRYQVLKEDVLRAGDELIITEVGGLFTMPLFLGCTLLICFKLQLMYYVTPSVQDSVRTRRI